MKKLVILLATKFWEVEGVDVGWLDSLRLKAFFLIFWLAFNSILNLWPASLAVYLLRQLRNGREREREDPLVHRKTAIF